MSVVIDLNLVCVICLQDGELRSVFEKDDHSELMISDKIMKCSELSIDENSKLPDKICTKCYQDLAIAFQFRQKCEAANAVFSSIQQQEDALASYELEQHKIKIPSGLKIKRIQPLNEAKTYILPVHVESLQELETVEEESASEIEADAYEESLEHTELVVERDEDEEEEEEEEEEKEEEEKEGEEKEEEEKEDEEKEEEDKEEEEEQMEAVELDDYFESEEILEEHFDQEIVEIKVETQAAESKEFDSLSTHTEKREIQIEMKPNVVIKQEEVKDEDEELVAEENMPPSHQHMSKRGRGRPKKVNDSPIKETSSPAALETCQANERLKQGSKGRISTNSSVAKPCVLKPLAVVQKMRKRNYLSQDAKPTKICDICGNSYKYQHALNAHMRRHNNDRPFNCEFCDKAFVSAVELRRHMRVHTGHKPYACQYCERRFSDFGSRIKHERTHTGERPYNCSTCGKAFAYAHVLSVHLRIHTGEKKFQCNLCGKGFTKKAYLKSHMEQHARAAALAGADVEATQDLDGGEMTAIKNVGLEECIFTTEYIDEEDTRSVASATVTIINEEHLEENDNEIEHVDEDDGSETIHDDFQDIEMKAKIEELSDDDCNYETVA